jgi:hypothetical protein
MRHEDKQATITLRHYHTETLPLGGAAKQANTTLSIQKYVTENCGTFFWMGNI